jgi:S1-C subfamily serine protease
MLYSDKNGDNMEEGATTPYQPLPQPQTLPREDLYRGQTDPNQYVAPGDKGRSGENYGPSAFPMQENMGQHPVQAMPSAQPDSSAPGDPRLGSNKMQARQLPMWGTPVPLNASTNVPASASGSRGWRTGAILGLTLVLLLVFGVGLFAGWVFGQKGLGSTSGQSSFSPLQTNSNKNASIPAVNNNSSNLDAVREAVVSKVEPAVVQINVKTNTGGDLGSGVIIDQRGYIVTNYHVVKGGRAIQVMLADNSKYTAQITGVDATDDLAVIKIDPPAALVTATLGDSSQLHVGQEVLAIGNPLGITQTVTRGIISALGRNVAEDQGGGNSTVLPGVIQTDAPINPGNSGGALVDLQGNVIGIPTLGAIDPEFNQAANGVGFAIPSNQVDFIARQLIQDGKVTHTGRPAMGITAQTVDTALSRTKQLAIDQGAWINSVADGSAAQHAGLQAGDVIVQIDSTQIDSMTALQNALLAKKPGDTISVKVYRGNQQLTVNVTLTELQVQSN